MQYIDFTEMPVWQEANEVVKHIYNLCAKLPVTESYVLISQMKRAAISIAANIAEAFGRSGTKDKMNFYFFARGSAFELRSHIIITFNLGFVTKQDINPVDQLIKSIVFNLNKIIKGLRQTKPKP